MAYPHDRDGLMPRDDICCINQHTHHDTNGRIPCPLPLAHSRAHAPVSLGIAYRYVSLHLVMKAPVWFLLGRIDLSGGSTGYHRAMLIDNFIHHFDNWYLIGTHDYVNWGRDMWDQANQYILEGENGGLVGFVFFIAMFYVCYLWIGNRRSSVKGDKKKEWLIWILGAAFFSQTMAFFGVDYFDQSKILWYLLLVIVTVITYLPAKENSLIQLTPAEELDNGIRKRWRAIDLDYGISGANQEESGRILSEPVPSGSETNHSSPEAPLSSPRLPRK